MALFQNILITAMAVFGVATSANSTASELDRLKWKNRILLIFSSDADSSALLRQRQLLSRSPADVGERDLVIVEIIGGKASALGQPGLGLDAKALQKRYQAEGASFKVVLIGKDGGSKLERDRPIDSTELFRTIDAMPMRQSEMR